MCVRVHNKNYPKTASTPDSPRISDVDPAKLPLVGGEEGEGGQRSLPLVDPLTLTIGEEEGGQGEGEALGAARRGTSRPSAAGCALQGRGGRLTLLVVVRTHANTRTYTYTHVHMFTRNYLTTNEVTHKHTYTHTRERERERERK